MMQKNSANGIFSPNLIVIALCFIIPLVGFGYILTALPGEAGESPICILGGWKLALIITHVLTFVLIPVAMRVFYDSLNVLLESEKFKRKAIFASQLGLSFIMVAIAAEIGWHVTQCWYYQNQFTILNFMFYFFLISAFALWANGLVEQTTWLTQTINLLFALGLLIVSILYPLGAEVNNSSYKIPIYIILTLVFAVLTYRGYKLLASWTIILFPLFSVGVNLTFIFLLDEYGHEPVTNALFHILHDLGGTEAGVVIFTWLIYQKAFAQQNSTSVMSARRRLS